MSKYIYKETTYLKDTINKKIHMIGIGGSSMSGLAEFLLHLGFHVSGSDMNASDLTDRLASLGADIYIGHNGENLKDPGLVVYTVAVKEDNPEFIAAKEKNIPIIDRSMLLGELLSLYPKSVSVAGTHGKTSTTSMVSNILMRSGKDPNVHIGGKIKNKPSNIIIGGPEYFINEACEYYNSFLHFKSFIGIVLNVEADHLDFFGTLEQVLDSFRNFVSIIPPEGYLVVCADNQNALDISSAASCHVITYSVDQPSAEFSAADIVFDHDGFACYTLLHHAKPVGTVHLHVPGLHNVSNSLAAIASCFYLGCSYTECIDGIDAFSGTSRRFEVKGTYNGITVVDDYAHHPSEIIATLKAAKKTSYHKIWAVFQPHTYTRAKKLFAEFAESFADCHGVVVTDIYAAREKDPGDIHSSQLAEAINAHSQNAIYIGSLEETAAYLKQNAQCGDIIITLGAGTVNQICKLLLADG